MISIRTEYHFQGFEQELKSETKPIIQALFR